MPTPPDGGPQERSAFRARELFTSWWEHRASFFISVGITHVAFFVYYFTFLGERPTPIFDFLQRLELDTLDMRFTYRPTSAPPGDPRIVIVDIDQHAQEVLGRWPFSRIHFAKLLDVLKKDGAKTAAFDITFSKPDQAGDAMRELWHELDGRKKRGESVDPRLEAQVKQIVGQFDSDDKFAASIKNSGAVVLGSYFLYSDADMRGMDDTTLDKYAEQLSFFSFPQIRPLDPRPEIGQRDRLNLIRTFGDESTSLIPLGAEANIPTLANSLGGNASATGFF